MELLLIRHALPVRHEGGTDPADPALAADGVAQAARLASYLSTEHLDAVYSSPMRRAVETAMPIASPRALDPVIVDGLAEWDREATEYVPVEELKAARDARWQALLDGAWDATGTPQEFLDRVVTTLEKLIDEHGGQRIAAVCHGGVINAYVAHILGLSGVQTAFFYPNYTSIHRIAAARSGERSIVTLNETPHLRGSGLPIGLFQRG